MFKKVFVILFMVMLIFVTGKLSFAMTCGEQSGSQQLGQAQGEHEHGALDATKDKDTAIKEPVNVGNEICPVSGEKIDEKTKATYEYDGKIYNFCCAMCIDEFKKAPQRYIDKVEGELKTYSQEGAKEKKD